MKRYLYSGITDIKYLLSFVLQKSQTWIWSNADYILTQDEQEQLEEWIQQRESSIPLAYITGEQPFYHLDFIVNQHTLIPRPETENIIDIVKNLGLKQAKILDLGTGSGIIAITLKHLFPNFEITAVDMSEQALSVAKKNAKKHNTEVKFIHSNWFKNVDGIFDIIISNPPYIEENDIHLDELRDPISALVAGENGLSDIKNIINFAPKYLTANGYLLLEHGYNQREDILQLLHNFQTIETFDDLNSQHRNILARL